MALEYQRHWICGACARAGRRDPADRVHAESLEGPAEALCCFCGQPGIEMGRIAVLVAPPPKPLPLFRLIQDRPGVKAGPPMLRILRGGKDDRHA